MPGAADWQNLPNSVTDSISNSDLADSWAQDQQTRIASDWANYQRMVPAPSAQPPPPAPTDASAPAGPAEAVYNVQPGDTLSGIAQRLGVPIGQLVSANKISNPNLINAGQTLNIGTSTAAPVGPGADMATSKPVASANGNVPDWLVQTIQNNAPDDLKDDPEFLKIVAAGSKAESNWDPRAVQQGGGGRGLFQFDIKGGMGKGATDAQINDPDWQASKILPRYAAAYKDGLAQGLKGAELASYVAAQAEHPLGYDNPQSAARQNYRTAYSQIQYTPGQAGAANAAPQAPSPSANDLDLAGTQTAMAGSPTGLPSPTGPQPVNQGAVPVENQRQFEQQAGLSDADAYSACGPVAAVAFAKTYGRNPTPAEAIQLAKEVGWTPGSGMAGVASEQALLTKMGTQTKLETSVNWSNVQKDVQNGNPVIISTPNHYFYVSDYDPASDTYGVGESGTVFKNGASRMSAADIAKRGGGISGALYVDHPQAEGPSVAETTSPPSNQSPIGAAASAVQQKLGEVKDAVASVLPDFGGMQQQQPQGAPPQQAITPLAQQTPTSPVTAPLTTSNFSNQGPLAGPSQAVTQTLQNQGGAIQPGNVNDLLNAATNAGADAIVSASPGLANTPTADTTKALVATGLSIYLGLVQPEAKAGVASDAVKTALGDEQTAIAQAAANGKAADLTEKLKALTDLVNSSDKADQAATQARVQANIDDIKAILHPTYDENGVALRQVNKIPAREAAPSEATAASVPTPTAPEPTAPPPPANEAPPAVTFDQNGNQLTGSPEAFTTPAPAPSPPAGQPTTPPPARPLSGRGGVPGADVGRQPVEVPATPEEAMARFQQQVQNMQSRPIDDVNTLLSDLGQKPTEAAPPTAAVSPPTEQPTELAAGLTPQAVAKSAAATFDPASIANTSVKDALNTFDQQTRGASQRLDQAVANGQVPKDQAQQALSNIRAKAFNQFVQDVKNANDPGAIRPKWQSGTAMQRGTALPKPDGWADGRQFSGLEDFYLSPETNNVVSNIWQQQFGKGTPLLTGLNRATSIAKEISLGGTFHMAQTGLQGAGVLREQAPVVMGKAFVAALDPTGNAYNAVRNSMSASFTRAADAGVTQLDRGLQEGDYAQMMRGPMGYVIRTLAGGAGGATLGALGDTNPNTRLQSAEQGALKGAAFGLASSFITPATFERWIPTLKAGSFQALVDRGVSDEAAAQTVNNLLGGQNITRMARSPLVTEISRTMMLAPDWWESFGRQLSQTVAPNLSPDSVQAKAATATTLVMLAASTEAMSYMFSGHSTLENPDADHKADIDMTKVWGPDPKTGQHQYMVIGGRWSDLINALASNQEGSLILNRAGIAPNIASTAVTGQTVTGYSPENVPASLRTNKYVTLNPYPGQPKPSASDKAVSIGANEVESLYPAGAQSVDRMASRGGLPAAVAAFLTGATERSQRKPVKGG